MYKLAREMTFALQSEGGAGFRQETSRGKGAKKRMQKGQEKGISCVQEGMGQDGDGCLHVDGVRTEDVEWNIIG